MKYDDIENWTKAKLEEELSKIEPVYTKLKRQLEKHKQEYSPWSTSPPYMTRPPAFDELVKDINKIRL